MKEKGRNDFVEGNWDSAINNYKLAIEKLPEGHNEIHICYSNTASCCLKKQDYIGCVEAATSSLKLNPMYIKALYLR